MLTLHAQSYSIAPSTGFYFTSLSDYLSQAVYYKTCCGTEEYAIQFIEGSEFACALAEALGLNQGNLASYLEAVEEMDDADETEQAAILYLLGDLGYDLQTALEMRDEIALSEASPEEAAHEYAEEVMGLTGFALRYFNAEAYARDCLLGGEWSEINYHGTKYTVLNASGL